MAPNPDAMTMDLHYAKHYLAFANVISKAIDSTEFEKISIEEILTKLHVNDENLKNYITAVMKVINWKKVGEKYEESLLKKY